MRESYLHRGIIPLILEELRIKAIFIIHQSLHQIQAAGIFIPIIAVVVVVVTLTHTIAVTIIGPRE